MTFIKKNWFAIVSIILILAIGATVVGILSKKTPDNSNSTPANTAPKQYVVLGDSIAYGYNLGLAEKNFATYIGENSDFEVTNHAVVGMTSEELLAKLVSGEFDVSNADLVTVTIGSNDLLHPFTDIISQDLGITAGSYEEIITEIAKKYLLNPKEIKTTLEKIKEDLENNPVFNDAIEKYKNETFPAIISEITSKNPNAEIVVTNLYNPFYGVKFLGLLTLGEIAEGYISQMNTTFTNIGYKTADVYSYFESHGLTNVNLNLEEPTKMSLDPHPNAQGHMVFFTIINEVLLGKNQLNLENKVSESSSN
jgi:lysophospholipase L1-like esterase